MEARWQFLFKLPDLQFQHYSHSAKEKVICECGVISGSHRIALKGSDGARGTNIFVAVK